MSKMINVIIDEIRALQTTEDNFLNDRDEVYFVLSGAIARAKTREAEPIHYPIRSPGSEGNDYWGLHNGESATNIHITNDPGIELQPGDAAYLVVAIREQDNAQLVSIEKILVGSSEALAGIFAAVLSEGTAAAVGVNLLVQGGATLIEGAVNFVNSLTTDGDQSIGAFDVRIANDNDVITTTIVGVSDVQVKSQNGAKSPTELEAHGSDANYTLKVSLDERARSTGGPLTVKPKGTNFSGPFIQSTFGRRGNFELIASQGSRLLHFFRDNDARRFPWHNATNIYNAAPATGGPILTTLPFPATATLIQSNFLNPGNLEVISRMSPRIPDGAGDTLGFFFMDGKSTRWFGPYAIIVDGE